MQVGSPLQVLGGGPEIEIVSMPFEISMNLCYKKIQEHTMVGGHLFQKRQCWSCGQNRPQANEACTWLAQGWSDKKAPLQ